MRITVPTLPLIALVLLWSGTGTAERPSGVRPLSAQEQAALVRAEWVADALGELGAERLRWELSEAGIRPPQRQEAARRLASREVKQTDGG